MYARLYDLWFVDQRARWRLYVGSIVIAFGYGVVNSLLLGRPEDRVTWETLGLLCATVFVFTTFYCTQKQPVAVEPESQLPHRREWLGLAVAGATAIILSLSLRPRTYMYRPSHKLASIRETLQAAEDQGTVLPSAQLAKYKGTIRATPSSTAEYWTTIAAIINYQSSLDQKSGGVPDPSKVAQPCITQNFIHNRFSGVPFSACVVSLDTNVFENVTFRDSVIEYRGGPVSLTNVSFINCRFVLKLPTRPAAAPVQTNLLLAILDSSDQKNVQVLR
jgi:hypothetical protein